jgi:hypothetical protein
MRNLFNSIRGICRFVVPVIFFALCAWAFEMGSVFASINQEITYQASLRDSTGHIVANGNYNIRFKLYATSTGGSNLWSEEWCKGACNGGAGADNRISVSGGLLSTQLGQITSLSSVDFNQPLWLSVEIGGSAASATWDGEMSPRKKIGASPSAFNSEKLNGQAASHYLDANNLTNFVSRWASVFSGTTTNALTEGSNNLYFTNTRARSALSSGSVALGYSTSTGVLTIADASTASSGIVTTGVQSFAGAKTFTGNITGNGALTIINSSSLATTSISGNLGVGVTANGDRLAVSGNVALGHFSTNSSLTSTTGYGKLYTKAATGDGNDAYTKIMLHFDAVDGSTVVTDSSSTQLPFSVVSGARISSSPPHFGIGVLSLNGTSSYIASAPVVDFTGTTLQDEFDLWVYPTSTTGTRTVQTTGLDLTTNYYSMYLNNGVPTFELQKDGGAVEVSIASSSSIPTSTWTHLALTRKWTGSTYLFSLYVGGSVVATGTATTSLGTSGNTACIGSNACFSGGNYFAGYMDELRFSRGLVRFNANFTPNTSPYGSGLFYLLDNGALNEIGGGGGGAGGSTIDTTSFHKGGDNFGSAAVIGLQDNFGLTFITNNTARIGITNDGKVGIGTTTPDTFFTVAGATKITGGLNLASLVGGILTVDASGTVSTTSSSVTITHSLSSAINVLTSIVNGVSATTTLVNSNVLSWSGNTLTSTVNGVSTSTNLSFASTTTDGLVSTSTQTFGGQKTFDGKIIASTTGNIIPFTFTNQAAFPSATTYRGAIAESDADGAMFFAFGGVWTQLLDAATGFKNNGNAFSALATLGTTDSFALRFIASSSEAMRIATSGRVAIGTTSPLAMFDVYGDAIIEGLNRYLNFGNTSGTGGYGFRDNSGMIQFKNSGGSWTNIATSTDGLAEGSSNFYYTDTRSRNAISVTATGLTYSTSTGVLSLTSGYNIPLVASTTNWQTFFTTPSTQITAGVGLTWVGNTLNGVFANATTDGLVSSSTQTFGGNKTFNGAVEIGSTLGVTGTSTLSTSTIAKLTVSDGVTFSSMTRGSVLFATTSGDLSQNNAKFFWDDGNNRLGIGTSTPTVTFHAVTNTIRLNDNQSTAPTRTNVGEIGIGAIGTGNNNGRIWIRAGSTATNFFFQSQATGDFSEFFRVTDMTLKTGEVMAIDVLLGVDASSTRYAARSVRAYDPQILGVVGRPGEGTANNNDRDGMRDFDPTYRNISILGQTPVLVNDENGLVKAGDRLTSSSRPGYAMKMTHGGMSIGYALNNATTSDQLVDIYLNPGQFMTPEEAGLVSELVATSTDISITGALGGLYRHLIAWFASTTNGIVDLFAGRVLTKEICVLNDAGDRTCLDKQALDSVLGNSNMSESAGPQSTGGGSSEGDGSGGQVSSTTPSDSGASSSGGGTSGGEGSGGSTSSTTPTDSGGQPPSEETSNPVVGSEDSPPPASDGGSQSSDAPPPTQDATPLSSAETPPSQDEGEPALAAGDASSGEN